MRKLDRQGSHDTESDVDGDGEGRALSITIDNDGRKGDTNGEMTVESEPLSANVVNHDR